MTTLNEIAQTSPKEITEQQKAYLRAHTTVDWSQVNLDEGQRCMNMLGFDPRTKEGKEAIIAFALLQYFRKTLGGSLRPLINQVIQAWLNEGVSMLVLHNSDEEIDHIVAHNRAINAAIFEKEIWEEKGEE